MLVEEYSVFALFTWSDFPCVLKAAFPLWEGRHALPSETQPRACPFFVSVHLDGRPQGGLLRELMNCFDAEFCGQLKDRNTT